MYMARRSHHSLVEKAFYLGKIVPKKNDISFNAKFYIDYKNDMPHPKAFGQIPKLSIFGRLENLGFREFFFF